MVVYADVVMALNFLVDFLLLMGTDRVAGFPGTPGRCAGAAGLGAVYSGACLMPGWFFLGNGLWRTVFLCLMAVMAFGCDRSTLRRGGVFVMLSMALGGVALGMGSSSKMRCFWGLRVAFAMTGISFLRVLPSGKVIVIVNPQVNLRSRVKLYNFAA